MVMQRYPSPTFTPGVKPAWGSICGFVQVLRDESLVSVLVVDDDVLFSCSFQEDLAMLLADTRCGAITQPEGPPSVLLLGSAIWIPGRYPRLSQFTGGWGMFEEEIRM